MSCAIRFRRRIGILDQSKNTGQSGQGSLLLRIGQSCVVIDIIKNSGLRGRGGAGFSPGTKWQLVSNATSDTKYVICNGDEGDPGAFMDRMLLESYPFRVIGYSEN